MKKLLFLLLLIGCKDTPKPIFFEEEEPDTIYIDTFIINKIYNAERMEDIFPSDTMDEGPSYDEFFKKGRGVIGSTSDFDSEGS